jgi:aspartate-semialdehyde dehydrogenase
MSAVAILHPVNLLGKELQETLKRRGGRWHDIRLLSTLDDEIGTLTEVHGAAAIVNAYEPESLEGIDVAFFCGPMAANRPLLADLPAGTTAIVLSLDATPEDGTPIVAGVNTGAVSSGRVLLSPHPAVVLLAHLLHPLHLFAPEEVVATVIQPASVQENAGLEELFEQTRQILAMTSRRSNPVFGTQLAFNLLPSPLSSEPVEAELRAVIQEPSIALQLLQGGVFHSVSASLYVRCASDPTLQAFRKALSENPHLETADKPRLLGPIEAAASDKVLLGTVRKEGAGGFWLWAVMDNLTRGGAENAAEIAEAVS